MEDIQKWIFDQDLQTVIKCIDWCRIYELSESFNKDKNRDPSEVMVQLTSDQGSLKVLLKNALMGSFNTLDDPINNLFTVSWITERVTSDKSCIEFFSPQFVNILAQIANKP